ncbi:CBP80/20-dependent translation initiation factor-like isoform X2 [Patiria miniata]|uniref:MIF4G domain-containing protein n=1 Tax=Patiria miniata TaxID=46514 RepID=A0A914BPY3_PATMI|nr:CBP80/20-dependent translation initiation factor-like isoform X2 [Patiria miniata]
MASARSLHAGLLSNETPNLRPTNYMGKGRGRGSRSKNTSNPSAPPGLVKKTDKEENAKNSPDEVEGNDAAPKAENKLGLLDLLQTMCHQHPNQRIIELSPEDESAIVEKALESISTGEELRNLVLDIYNWTLQDPATTSCVASLCATLAKFEKDEVNFRSTLLKPLQEDFQSRDQWRKEKQTRWLSFVCFLCDLYALMKTAADGYLHILVEPVYSCLDQLLTDNEASDIQIEYATLKLKQLGKILQSNQPSQMELLMDNLRTRLLGPGTTAIGRLLLLESIELYASGWQFDDEAAKAYDELKQMTSEKA